jgi:hypothetical protein
MQKHEHERNAEWLLKESAAVSALVMSLVDYYKKASKKAGAG